MRRTLVAVGCLLVAAGAGLWSQRLQLPPKEAVIRHLIFEVYPNSIEPRTVTVEEGWWMIRIRNGITTVGADIHVEDSQGAKVAVQRSLPLSSKTALLMNLQQGRHVLKVPGKSDWQVEILVKAKAR